ncbi:hypothetical protein ACLOJK_037013 [Asimina triloba]
MGFLLAGDRSGGYADFRWKVVVHRRWDLDRGFWTLARVELEARAEGAGAKTELADVQDAAQLTVMVLPCLC